MSDATEVAVTVTMDRAGRLVVPKAIRDGAGFAPGTPLRIRVRDGRIEIEPTYEVVRTVEADGLCVMERVDPGEPLTTAEVRRVTRAVRERRKS